jgi:peptide/nickel transport system substrate-binding protein
MTRLPLSAMAVPALLLGLGGAAAAQTRGGDLVYMQQSTPPTLDGMVSTEQAVRNVVMNIFEMLIALDEGANPVPDLAASYTESADGLVYEFKLRPGVKFHNGKPMTSADIKATFERYGRVGTDRQDFPLIAEIATPDVLTVKVALKQRIPSFIEQISSPRAPMVVIPAEQAGRETGKIDIIGTGPFELVEYLPDSHVKLKRFDDYTPNPNYKDVDGLAGRKVVHVDTVTFRVVPEANARVAALETRSAHMSEQITNQSAKRLKDSTEIKVLPLMPWSMAGMIVNAGWGATTALGVRRAIQIAIDAEELLEVANDGVYRLNHGFIYPESQYWTGDAGKAVYSKGDKAKAKALLQEAGYKGEEIVVLGSSQVTHIRQQAQMAVDQLKAAGMNAKIELSDTPTYIARAQRPEGWNLYVGEWGLAPWLGPYGVPNFWTGPKNWQKKADQPLEDAFADLKSKPALNDRKAAAVRFYERLFDQAFAVKFGDNGLLQAVRTELVGFKPYRVPRGWGVSLR